jgi:hypothetical protein
MSDAKLNKAPIVAQTRVWSNALPRRDPEERARTSHLTGISGPIIDIVRVLTPAAGAQ